MKQKPLNKQLVHVSNGDSNKDIHLANNMGARKCLFMCGAAIDLPMSAAFTTKTAVWSPAEPSPESHQLGGLRLCRRA